MNFRFISDPGHGWIEVPVQLVSLLNLQDKISRYSYRKGDMAYLEEDCDASLFMQACKQQGIEVKFTEVHQERTPIRSYARW